jgi:hypothetical protein
MRLYDRTGDPITSDAGDRIEIWAARPATAAFTPNSLMACYHAVAPD